MRRIVIAIGLSGLLAACGQQAQPAGEGGSAAPLDFIDAVPIDENAPAPVAQPQAAARKEEPEAEKAAEKDEPETPAAQTTPSTTEPPAEADDAASATRRANETTATPYVVVAPETPARPD